jgi:hypothetical protein
LGWCIALFLFSLRVTKITRVVAEGIEAVAFDVNVDFFIANGYWNGGE